MGNIAYPLSSAAPPISPLLRYCCCCCADAQKTGVAQEAVKTASGKLGQMAPQEAKLILGVEKGMPWGEVVKVCCALRVSLFGSEGGEPGR